MREILIRGKRIDNGEWVYGGYYVIPDGEGGAIHRIAVSDCERFEYNDVVVDHSSISEFTGLSDKNNKKIFEGDIISVPGSKKPGLPGIVLFHQLDAKYILFRQRYSYLNLINVNNWGYVIGNIHDNPELLKGEQHD